MPEEGPLVLVSFVACLGCGAPIPGGLDCPACAKELDRACEEAFKRWGTRIPEVWPES